MINYDDNVENDEESSTQKLVASKSMCYSCFDTLIYALDHPNRSKNRENKKPGCGFLKELPNPTIQSPLFVTWEKRKNENEPSAWQLRGCIGCLNPRPLATDVAEYAMISALRDRRFPPISLEEIPLLRVSVSLLVDYEYCKDVYDWTIGVHGILIKFTVDGIGFDGTFLPEVAKQQGWDHATTVSSLIRKAGYRKSIDQVLLDSIRCTRYQSSKCPVSYDEYVQNKCDGNNPIPLDTKRSPSRPWYKKFTGM